MELTTAQISELVGGAVEGDPNVVITRLMRIEDGVTGALSFLHDPRYYPHLYETGASAVLVKRDFAPSQAVGPTLIRVEDPYRAFHKLLKLAEAARLPAPGRSEHAYIDPTADVSEEAWVGPFVYVGPGAIVGPGVRLFPHVYVGENVLIGPNTIVNPNVSIYPDCIVGAGCILHAGCVVGADGFGYVYDEKKGYEKVPQAGNVVIEDEVEIGANACIDRAMLGSTYIRRGVKLDNLVQIAHNVDVGAHSAIAAQAGVSGSVRIGKGVRIAGQVGVTGHLQLADYMQIGAQSGVTKSYLQPGTVLRGAPAQPMKQQMKQEAYMRQLPELARRLDELENKLAKLDGRDGDAA